MRGKVTILMFQEIRPDDFGVHNDTAVVLDRSHAPHEEDALEEPVEGNHLCDVQREKLDHWESGENYLRISIIIYELSSKFLLITQ